jgi:hypothetical protein
MREKIKKAGASSGLIVKLPSGRSGTCRDTPNYKRAGLCRGASGYAGIHRDKQTSTTAVDSALLLVFSIIQSD